MTRQIGVTLKPLPILTALFVIVFMAGYTFAQDSRPKKPEPKPADKTPKSDVNAALMNPSLATAEAPAKYRVKFETTKGEFTVEVVREWTTRGADRFYNLVKIGYFTDIAFFRVIPRFMAQFEQLYVGE